MFFISKKRFQQEVEEVMGNKVNAQVNQAFIYFKTTQEEFVKQLVEKEQKDELNILFDKWVEASLAETKTVHVNSNGWGSYQTSGPSKVERSLNGALRIAVESIMKEISEMQSFSTKEEFIDRVVERIQKKQISK